ncbi:TraB/GumN family protein [Lacinutrix iliipiscaria]|uniref:TraB/GumN family protein n=1 Tax=Lacinutrix iliipiscaria TaxID=1230532 RepID=A0ABW5WPI5_9FLAO
MHHFLKNYIQSAICFSLLVLLSFSTNAQDTSKYQLLWKIEGLNSKKPSYLFGTMHLDDSRAFNFSDAVFPAMKSSEKFALEVQPDSLILQMASQKFETKAHLVFKELMSEEEYKQLEDRFFEVNGFTLEESDIDDPDALLAMFEPDEEKDDDKARFVDLHLLAHAKTMQKQIIGLENIDNQMNHFAKLSKDEKRETLLEIVEYDIDTYKSQMEDMINIYITGDINAIDAFLILHDGYDDELARRNKEMSHSINHEIENGSSVFSAVGAAHLPGEFGIINLLKKKGYQVTPVEANFTGVANNYEIDDSKMLWKTYTNADLGYSVETPSEVTIDNSSSRIAINSSTDLVSEKLYSFFAIDIRANPQKEDKEAIYSQVIDNAIAKYEAENIIKKNITIDGASGYDIIFEFKEKEAFSAVRSIYLIKNGIFYQFFILGNQEKVNSKSANRFFNSITFFKPKPLPVASDVWIDYYNKKGAFSIQLPTEPKDSSREVNSGLEGVTEMTVLNMYSSQDMVNKDNYIVRYNDFPLGYRLEDLEASFKSIENSFLATSEILSEPKVIYKDGYEGRQYELLIKEVSHGICKLFFRGNRTYMLLSHKLEKGKKTDPNNHFFESFKFEDFIDEDIEEHSTEDFSFKTLKSNMYNIDEDDYTDSYFVKSNDYYSRNNNSGDMYAFGYSKLKPYFKIDTLQKFFETNKENLLSYNETATHEKTVFINEVEAFEFIAISDNDSIKTKHVMWLDNDYFFLASAYTNNENINSALTQEILYSYRNKNKNKTLDYYASKTDEILNDLKSNDSLVFKNAIGAFEYYEFDDSDLKKLYQATQSDYASAENKTLVLSTIISEFNLINDEETLPFVEKLYQQTDVNDDAKRDILTLIPQLENENRLEIFKALFFNNPPKKEANYNYSLFSPFRDSTDFAIKNYKDFISLKDISNYKTQVLSISAHILQSDHSKKEEVLSHFNKLTDSALVDLKSFQDMLSSEEDYDYAQHNLMYNYLNYLKSVPESSHIDFIDNFTEPIVTSDAKRWLIFEAAQTRIKHHLPIKKETKSSLLDSLDTRFSMIKSYHQVNKLNEVPNNYITQKAFSKLSLEQYLSDSDEYPTETKLIGELKVKSQLYHVYSLNYTYENPEDNESYLAVVEPSYKVTQQNEYKAYPVITDWDLLEEDWKAQAERLILKPLESE